MTIGKCQEQQQEEQEQEQEQEQQQLLPLYDLGFAAGKNGLEQRNLVLRICWCYGKPRPVFI